MPFILGMQIGSETDFRTYGIRQVKHEKIIQLLVVLTVSRFPWKAALYFTCNSKEKNNEESVLIFCAAKMSASNCSGPALCDTSSDIFISHFYSLPFLTLLCPSSSDLTSLEIQNKALIHLTKALKVTSKSVL